MSLINFITSKWIEILTILVATATLIYIFRENRRQEISILRSLLQHSEFIKKTTESQHRYLKAETVPTWTLIEIDLNYYLPRINYKIKKQGFTLEKVFSRELKDNLVQMSRNANQINNLFGQIYNAEFVGNGKIREEYVKELLKNPYYEEIFSHCDKVSMEIKKIINPFRRKILFWF